MKNIKSLNKIMFSILMIVGIMSMELATAQSGNMSGRIIDQRTGEALIGANIMLDGSAIGTATNEVGEYILRNLPGGEQVFRVGYLGYISRQIEVTIIAGETVGLDIELEPDVIAGDEVVFYAQALAQAEAIRRQLASNTIINVVSESRLREMPDANAAESVGRLPGVSIIRSAGEAQKVTIRGLAPQYNSVTVDGDRMTSTDLNDRSVDMSMISPEMLSGIEVYKVLRPDMDADAIGGSVNFSFSGAPSENQYRLSLSGGYHNHINGIGSYKGSGSASGRFFGERLGILGTASTERTDRSSHDFNANYNILRSAREDEPHAPIETTSMQLTDRTEIRERYGAGLNLDYKIPGGRLFLNNFYSRLERDELMARRSYVVSAGRQDWQLRNRIFHVNSLTSSLRGEHKIFDGLANIDWRFSRNESRQDRPYDNWVNFRETGALNRDIYITGMAPHEIPATYRDNLDMTSLYDLNHRTYDARERDYTASVDIEIPILVSNQVTGKVKFGDKHTDKDRYREGRGYSIRNFMFVPRYRSYAILTRDYFPQAKANDGRPAIGPYVIDDPFTILDGQYDMRLHFNRNLINAPWDNDADLFQRIFAERLNDYNAIERVSAGYILTELNIGRRLMILPGVRYEKENSDYHAISRDHGGGFGDDQDDWEQFEAMLDHVSANRTVGMWFPMVQMRYQIVNWLDLRLGRTQTTSRPSFSQLTPRRIIDDNDRTVNRGMPDLELPKATNYDVILTFHSNRIGLFSIGGFYKEIDNLVFNRQTVAIEPESMGLPEDAIGFIVNEPMNNPNVTKLEGFEVEWQSNLSWLPPPFNGLVINANFTKIYSETNYPGFRTERTSQGTVVIDTFRTAPMVHQPDYISNISVGYDIRGFSVRVSMLYQGATLTSIGSRPETDQFTSDYLRWDLSVKQNLFDGVASVFLNAQNLSNRRDFSMQFTNQYPRAMEYYGLTVDLGLRIQF